MLYIKTPEEIEKMREGGKKLASIMQGLLDMCEVGVDTMLIEEEALKRIKEAGGSPAFKGYQGYPAATCISINQEVVHTPPKEGKAFKSGDIVGIDIGLEYKGMFTDMARTKGIGDVSSKDEELMQVTKECLDRAIKKVKPGNRIGDISYAIEELALKKGFGIVRDLVGHGVGKEVHEDPKIPNFGEKGRGMFLEEGLTIAIEPMLTIGKHHITTEKDNWTIVTQDGTNSAHFEDTMVVTKDGVDILTR